MRKENGLTFSGEFNSSDLEKIEKVMIERFEKFAPKVEEVTGKKNRNARIYIYINYKMEDNSEVLFSKGCGSYSWKEDSEELRQTLLDGLHFWRCNETRIKRYHISMDYIIERV